MIIKLANIINEKELINNEYALLSKKKRVEMDKIIGQRREESLLGRALVRQLLKENGFNEKILFGKTANGRPYTIPKTMNFSISHSEGNVIAALSKKKIGIDLEILRDIDLCLCKKACTASETGWILKANSISEQQKRFFILWTLKESYMKVIGKGMRIPFKSIAFDVTDDYKIINSIKEYDFTVAVKDNMVVSTAEKR